MSAPRSRRAELATLYDLSRALGDTDDLNTILDRVARGAVTASHVTFSRVALCQAQDLVVRAAHPIRALERDLQLGQRAPLAMLPVCQRALQQGEPIILHSDSPEVSEAERELFFLDSVSTLCLVPLHIGREPLGVLMLGEARAEERAPMTEEKIRLMRGIGEQAASAIHRAQLHAQTERRLRHLTALRSVDVAIAGSLDLRLTLNVALDEATRQLGVDAAAVLLFNPHAQVLEFAAARGFRSKAIEQSRLRLGEGHAGRAALERTLISIPDLVKTQEQFVRAKLLEGEGFVAYHALPLVAKGQVRGVLEVFHRRPLEVDSDWLEFFQTLAGQTAIAIDNASLFESLQRANIDLTLAYDATIEGWSRALDLRDKETEGHTQRVTQMTVDLARAMGVSEAEIVHVRRGALLHDIGKMGVPDAVLLKPGPLTDAEWVLMRHHPQFAFDMLAPIAYLKPALDIPYAHHEKWDGTGYPRGLKGEQIPLAARIFAVIDVWDALTSDRPYRAAWSQAQARAYIRDQAGKHFDPAVVEVFLEVVQG